MADFTDVLKLNDLEHGAIHQIVCNNQLIWRRPNQNLNRVPLSIDIDGSIYNGCGYIENYRLESSGGIAGKDNIISTGYIPYTAGDVIRLYGVSWTPAFNCYTYADRFCYISFYDKNFSILGSVNVDNLKQNTSRGICGTDESAHTIIEDPINCMTEFHISFTDSSAIKYFRINGCGRPENMIVTINEPIVDKKLFSNQVPRSITTDGNIFNDYGYKDCWRTRSGGAEAEANAATTTGYIPLKKGDIIRISPAFTGLNAENAINFYDSNFTNLGQIVDTGYGYGICSGKGSIYKSNVIDDVSTLTYSNDFDTNIAYIRITHAIQTVKSGSSLIVTVNEEIKYGTGLEKPYTNVRPLAVDYLGNPYGHLGYKNSYRLNSSCTPVSARGMSVTGFIPCKMGDIVRLQGINFNKNSINYGIHRIAFFNSNKACICIV